MENNHIISFKDAKIGYPTKGLVEKVNIDLVQGQLIALTGLNGVGKTSFFKTLLKEIPLQSGKCFIEKESLNNLDIKDWISVVYTDKLNVLGLTVRDILETGKWMKANWRGILKKDDIQFIDSQIKLLSLEAILYEQVNKLSDGQFQKVMIAKALIQETPIMLLDEPTAFLDIKNKKEIFELLKWLVVRDNKTIIVSTHDIEFCKQYCDKILVIKNNSLTEIKGELLENYLLNE